VLKGGTLKIFEQAACCVSEAVYIRRLRETRGEQRHSIVRTSDTVSSFHGKAQEAVRFLREAAGTAEVPMQGGIVLWCGMSEGVVAHSQETLLGVPIKRP
jgi:hypothetical protein